MDQNQEKNPATQGSRGEVAEVESERETQWAMFAHRYPTGHFVHVGPEFYVKNHLLNDPIIPVTVSEEPNGRYWGWIVTGEDTPRMIWPSEVQFKMCFPYGPEAEQERGRGRIVRLKIEASQRDAPPYRSK